MRGAALADTHLGFRAFSRLEAGRNLRELDVERAWKHAIQQILVQDVDLVTIAGDVFHHPRVSDYAKHAFLAGIDALVAAGIVVVVIQGNHDSGRTADVLTPIWLATAGDSDFLRVVTEPERLDLQLGMESVSISCFPFVARAEQRVFSIEPNPDADVNVLLMHAAVKGDSLPHFYGGEHALDIRQEAARWDVIALGDYHEHAILAPEGRVFYSGSLERTSSNIWQETAPKGFVVWDTDKPGIEFVPVPTRSMVSYTLNDLEDLEPSAEAVNFAVVTLSLLDVLKDAIVRLKVDDFPREERQHIDMAKVRELKQFCAHFYLDLHYRQAEAPDLGDLRDRGRALSLATEAADFFAEDPPEVRELALRYLDVEAEVEGVLDG